MPQAASTERVERPIAKSPAAFRTIAEVGADLDLPSHVLRFWESKFPEIKPLKRRGGRRYYRPEDVALLRQIRTLLYIEGYTIKGVQRLLRESGSRSVSPAPADAAARKSAEPPVVAAAEPPVAAAEASLPAASLRDALRPLLTELQALRALLREHDA